MWQIDTSIQRLLKMKKYIFWVNAHTPIEKQSNEDWNTSVYLKNNDPSIKVTLTFWCLVMTFSLCFYHQLWVKWVGIHIGNINILEKLIHRSRNVCVCWTLNKMNNELASLITCSIKDNLINTSSISPHEVRKQYYIE